MRLALVSDTHLTPRSAVFTDNWRAISARIAEIAPDVRVHFGDITADGAHQPGELEHARATFAGLRRCGFSPAIAISATIRSRRAPRTTIHSTADVSPSTGSCSAPTAGRSMQALTLELGEFGHRIRVHHADRPRPAQHS
jgi:hypothetical protein